MNGSSHGFHDRPQTFMSSETCQDCRFDRTSRKSTDGEKGLEATRRTYVRKDCSGGPLQRVYLREDFRGKSLVCTMLGMRIAIAWWMKMRDEKRRWIECGSARRGGGRRDARPPWQSGAPGGMKCRTSEGGSNACTTPIVQSCISCVAGRCNGGTCNILPKNVAKRCIELSHCQRSRLARERRKKECAHSRARKRDR
jgi:hypothetical protein